MRAKRELILKGRKIQRDERLVDWRGLVGGDWGKGGRGREVEGERRNYN